MRPEPYQEADIRALLAHNATGAVAAETGAGKTLIGAEVARRSGLPVKLIIAPRGTHEKEWKGTLTALDPDARVRTISGDDAGKAALDDLEWKVPGYYLITPQLFTRMKPKHLRPDLTIVDEFHMLGNSDSAGGELIKRWGNNSGHRIALSGTFWRNKFENAWTLMRFLYPERDAPGDIADISKNRWIDDYCETVYDHFAPDSARWSAS
jgi:superfamily II DNA or RNA helicase